MLKIFLTSVILVSALFPVTSFAHGIEVKQTEIGDDFTHHVEAIITTIDGKDLPYAQKVEVKISESDTKIDVGEIVLHPMFGAFFHYGANVRLVENKQYQLNFKIHPPTFMRDNSTKDKWIEHIEAEITLDTSKDYSSGEIIGKIETDDTNVTFMVFPAKSMFELLFDGESMMQGHGTEESPDEEPDTNLVVFNPLLTLVIGFLFGNLTLFVVRKFRK